MSLPLPSGLSISCDPLIHNDPEERSGMLMATASFAATGGFGFCGAVLLHGSPLFLGLTAAISGVGLLGCWPSTGCYVPTCRHEAGLGVRVVTQQEAPTQQGFEEGDIIQEIAFTETSTSSSTL